MTIKRVAILGASGSLGSVVLEKLQASGLFKIRVLRRPSSSARFPPTIEVVDVNLRSLETITAALDGQDALVSCLGTSQVPEQQCLADACVAAGVHRFIPAEFGADIENSKVQSLPLYAPHMNVRNRIIQASKESNLTYTFVHNGAFLDWGLEHDFILKLSDYCPILIDEGKHIFSATTLASIADAVLGILSNPSETSNRAVFIEDIKITQRQLYDLAREIAPSRPWNLTVIALDSLPTKDDTAEQSALEISARQFLNEYYDEYRALLDPGCGGNFGTTDNELFGLKAKGLEDVRDLLRLYIKM